VLAKAGTLPLETLGPPPLFFLSTLSGKPYLGPTLDCDPPTYASHIVRIIEMSDSERLVD
jgi:hypothetical protein